MVLSGPSRRGLHSETKVPSLRSFPLRAMCSFIFSSTLVQSRLVNVEAFTPAQHLIFDAGHPIRDLRTPRHLIDFNLFRSRERRDRGRVPEP